MWKERLRSWMIHDFNYKEAKDIVNPLLAEEVRYLKENKEVEARCANF